MPHRLAHGLVRFVRAVEALNERLGRVLGWLTLAMVGVVFSVALLRYAFSTGWVWMQESYLWLHATVFMLGVSYTLGTDRHVRVDIFYRPAGARARAAIDLAGALALVLPLAVVVFWWSLPYVVASWRTLESSREAGGLAGLFLLKSLLLLAPALLALQGAAMAARALLALTAPADRE